MKLLLIVDDYLPKSTSVAAKMMHELALELKNNGYDILVLAPEPMQKERLTIQKLDGIIFCFSEAVELNKSEK